MQVAFGSILLTLWNLHAGVEAANKGKLHLARSHTDAEVIVEAPKEEPSPRACELIQQCPACKDGHRPNNECRDDSECNGEKPYCCPTCCIKGPTDFDVTSWLVCTKNSNSSSLNPPPSP